ncbi:MAG: ABC transporter ATP-binding protein [Candidatus Eremiobacteraeota bacterium]|nr:ABC transporter ATP-binding protein [Candidatus Eremiobacteraeota bacterium]
MLKLHDVHAYYEESHVLRGVELDVHPGEVVTLVGRNGVGKTTTLKTIMGIVRAAKGTIAFDGRPIAGLPSNEIARLGIGFVPEERGIMSSLSVYENLTLPPIVERAGAWPLERIYQTFPILKERAKAVGTTLSGGEQQMLSIARILRSGSKLILLDEPTEGLAPVIVEEIGRVIREMKAVGVTVLLVEQNVRFTLGVADRHYLMAHGRVIESLTNAEMAARETELLEHLGV